MAATHTPALFSFKNLPARLRIGESLPNSPWLDLVVGADNGVDAVEDVVFELVGFAKVALVITPDSLLATDADRMAGQVRHVNSEEVFTTVTQKLAEPQKLNKGSHTYSLAMNVPPNLFPSFTYTTVDRSEVYSVRYVLRARLPMRDNKDIILEHPVVLTAASIPVDSMSPLRFMDAVGSSYGSVLSLQSRRNMFLPLQPMTLLYSHQAPPNWPIRATYMELRQKAVIPCTISGRRVVERLIATYELPSIPQSMAGTYTLKLQLPQLPPSILLGPIDITYFFLCVATFPDERIGNGGHEVIGPIDFEVLPDVQRISIEPGFDEAVEFLEGMGGMNGPMVRPRVLQLVPWSPPDLISPLQEPQRLGSLGGENMPGMFPSTPVRTGSEPPPPLGFPQPPFQQMAMPPPTMMMGQQFYQQQQQMPNWQGTMTPGMFPGPPPPSAVHLAAEVSMQQQLQADEQSRQIVEAQEELGRIQQETARARELLAQKQREETEKARLEAYQEAERKLQEEREQLEVLRHQLSQMKSSAMLKTATTATITAAPSLAAPTEPTVTNRLSQGNFSSQYQQPPQPSYIPVHHQNSYAPPPGTAWLDDAYGSPSRDPRLTPINTGQQTAITPIPTHSPIEDNPHNPALETHSYPKPASLSINNAPPPRQTPSYSDYSNTPTQPSRSNSGLNRPGDIPPSPSTTPQPLMSAAATPTPSTASQPKPKKKWWFSKSPSQSTSANTSSASLSSPRPSNAAQAAPQLNNTELLINQICDDATSNYRRSIKRNYKALMGARDRDANKRKYLNEASGAVKGILERDGDVRGVLDALQAEFLVIDQETIQSFENDKRDSLLRQIRSLKSGLLTAIQAQAITDINDLQEQFASVLKPLREDLKESVFYPGMGDTEKRVLEELANRVWSDCIKTFERDVKGPCVAELDKLNKKSGRGGSVGNSGSSGGGTWGRASASSSSSSLSSGRQPPQPQKDTTISVCLRPDCGKKKVGYGQSKLFCSIQCEKQMNQEQMRAMSNYS